MKSLFVTLCIASLTTTVTSCVLDSWDQATDVEDVPNVEDVAESRADLIFAPGDSDLTWSGPATYSAGWAQQAFKPYPGLYIVKLGPTQYAGTVYLSAPVACRFSSFQENSERIIVSTNDCDGPFNNLTVSLNCLKLSGDLACTGSLSTAGGLTSNWTVSMEREEVCAPGNCFIGPLDPVPPGPNGPADCGEGESPCGRGCCLRGERCGDSKCYIPEEGDEVISER
jgi:hypothetical protein